MADIRISQLPELEAAPADSDVLILNDVSVASTKKITFGNLLSNYASNIVDSADGAKCTGDFVVANELTLGGDLNSTVTASFGTVNTNNLENTDGTGVQMNSNLKFQDGKQARFGDAGDLKIYHDSDGTLTSTFNSYIDETGSGSLYIRSNGAGIVLRDKTTDLNFLSCLTASGETRLFYNGDGANDLRLKTFDSGCDITGFTRTDQLRVTTPGATPTSSTPGQNGEIRYDTSYIYIYQSGAWYRASLALVP